MSTFSEVVRSEICPGHPMATTLNKSINGSSGRLTSKPRSDIVLKVWFRCSTASMLPQSVDPYLLGIKLLWTPYDQIAIITMPQMNSWYESVMISGS
jgi:hypothetical protein